MSYRQDHQVVDRDEDERGAAQQLITASPAPKQIRIRSTDSGSSSMGRFNRRETAKCLQSNLLTLLTVVGVASGLALGFALRSSRDKWTEREQSYVKFVGDIFLRMLKALILPLIVSSLVHAVGSLDLSLSKKIGFRAIAYYMVTTVCAVVLGIILVVAIHPGRKETQGTFETSDGRNVTTVDTLMDLVRNIFPPNLIQATLYQYQTELIKPPDTYEDILNNRTKDLLEWKMKSKMVDGTNIMGLVAFSTVLGVCLGQMGSKGKPLLDFFESLSLAMMKITNWVVWFSPIGIVFLIAAQMLAEDDLGDILNKLGWYFMTVMIGLFIHGFVLLPFIYLVVTRSFPFRFVVNMTQALFTAFGTASSSATLPITMDCLEKKNGVDPRVSRFVLPIGATINMDGTALYEAVAAIFIAQIHGLPLSLGNIVAISITATAASIGAAGIPQAGLVTMVMVLNTVGLPGEYVSYIIPVDWLLDRFRTAINVLGDSLGAGLVDYISKAELKSMPIPDENELEMEKLRQDKAGTSYDDAEV